MRISAREACVKPHLRTRSDIKYILYTFEYLHINGRPLPVAFASLRLIVKVTICVNDDCDD